MRDGDHAPEGIHVEGVRHAIPIPSWCVDDVDLASQRSEAQVAADSLAAAARTLVTLLERALLLQVAYYKCVVLASSPAVEKRLRERLVGTGLRLQEWGKKLGIQFSLRQRRRFALLRQHAMRARGRAWRVRMLQRAAGAKTRARLYNAGIHPVALYGGSYWGFSPSSITELRRQAIIAAMPPARFCVPGLVFNLKVHDIFDPAVACRQMPIVGWARGVWSSNIDLGKLNL